MQQGQSATYDGDDEEDVDGDASAEVDDYGEEVEGEEGKQQKGNRRSNSIAADARSKSRHVASVSDSCLLFCDAWWDSRGWGGAGGDL